MEASWPFSARRVFTRSGPIAPFATVCSRLLDRFLGLSDAEALYHDIVTEGGPRQTSVEFVPRMHRLMNVSWSTSQESLLRIPESGPLILVANHPFGGIEATMLLEMIRSVRPDVKFMANFMLSMLPETRDACVFVDPFGRSDSALKNMRPLRESIEWVQKGGALCIFPAGTVSHFNWRYSDVRDPEWSLTVARIIRKAEAPVLPIFVHGRNGVMFQIAGIVHPFLRTALLVREFVNKRGKSLRFGIGRIIPYEKLQTFRDDRALTAYLRMRTYILANDASPLQAKPAVPDRELEPIVLPKASDVLAAEIARLPVRQRLVEKGENEVFIARAGQIPNVLFEIGRLREETFRAVNEGTGKSVDTDRFDRYYLHLFIWNRAKGEIVGAYRLAKADRILRRFGRKGLYTNTLFNYRRAVLEQLGPALELGRSFVRGEYQKSYDPLLLLWQGIGRYVAQNPRYAVLFGPVSINSDYHPLARNVIMSFLRSHTFGDDLASFVRPRRPAPERKVLGLDSEITRHLVRDLRDVADLLREIESSQKSVPILLRQYVKLGGKFIGFNLDPEFGNVLDGLIYVDLRKTESRLLERYMEADGMARFHAFHNVSETRSA